MPDPRLGERVGACVAQLNGSNQSMAVRCRTSVLGEWIYSGGAMLRLSRPIGAPSLAWTSTGRPVPSRARRQCRVLRD